MKERPEIPEEEIIEVKHDSKKIDFSKPYKFVYDEFWFDILTFPFYVFAIIFCFLSARFFSLRIRGRKNLRILGKKGCIVVSNHCHYFDTVFTSYRILPRRLFITVVQRNFEVPIVRRILKIFRALPIPASPVGFKMITEPIGRLLAKKNHVMFLPEGELVFMSQTIHRFRPGAFYQSYMHQAPILPFVYLLERRRLFGKEMGAAWAKFTQVIGEPFYPPPPREDGKFPKEELDIYADSVATWMEDQISVYHSRKGE